uniref:Uncharacterized protein n=1 Tax=Peronospora matthiolae TaxID=2874970 RepID=A0AAV1TPI4_9STRA
MFTSSKFAAVCLTVTALFNDVNAEAEVVQTFGLLGSGYRAPSHAGPYGAPSNAGPYGASSGGVYGGVYGGVVASVRPTGRSAGHDGLGVENLGRGTGVGNAYGGTSSGGVFGGCGVTNNVYGGVGGAVRPGVGATNGSGRPVSGAPSGPVGAGAIVNTGPYGGVGEITRPEAGKPANGGASGNVAGATDDKKNDNVYGGVSGATDTGAAVTKGAGKPVSDGKDVPAVVAGDKNAVPVVAASGAAVPEAGKPANGGASGNVAGATDDKKNTNVYGVVSGATDTGAAVTKGAEKPVSDGKDVPAVVAGDKNAVPVVAASGAAVPEAGKLVNGGTSGNVAGATDDKKNDNVYGGVSGATDTGAAVTKGAGKPVSDGKDVPAVVAGDKNAVPVVAAGVAAVPEAGKLVNGGTSGNVAGATDDKKNDNVYGGVSGAADSGAVVTKGAGKPTTDGKDRGIVAGADGKPCTDGAGGAIGSALKPTPMVNGNTISAKPLKSGDKVISKPTTASPYNGRVGGVTQRAYRKLRSL